MTATTIELHSSVSVKSGQYMKINYFSLRGVIMGLRTRSFWRRTGWSLDGSVPKYIWGKSKNNASHNLTPPGPPRNMRTTRDTPLQNLKLSMTFDSKLLPRHFLNVSLSLFYAAAGDAIVCNIYYFPG